jgi:hypothetical protein
MYKYVRGIDFVSISMTFPVGLKNCSDGLVFVAFLLSLFNFLVINVLIF